MYARQQAVMRLDPAAFEAVHGRTDLVHFVQGIYALAQQHRCLDVVASDQDLVTFNLQRAPILQRPATPVAGAAATVSKHYEIQLALYEKQSNALAIIKTAVVQAMDQEALAVINDPIHGTLRLAVLDIIAMLRAEYQDMTNAELKTLKNELMAMRWDASTNIVPFLSDFTQRVAFLDQHAFAPTVGEQVITLQEAVAHVPHFALKADASFHDEHRQRAAQTLPNLVATYRRVYRTMSFTAEDHHAANQVKASAAPVNQLPNEDLTHIMASARAVIRDTKLTPEQLDTLSVEISKTVARVLRPSEQSRDRGGDRSRGGGGARSSTSRGQDSSRTEVNAPRAGYCPLHQYHKHTWDECRLNPAKKA